VLHENTGFVDEVIVKFLKQSQRMVTLSAFGLVDFVVGVVLFRTFITTVERLPCTSLGMEYMIPEPARTVESLDTAWHITRDAQNQLFGGQHLRRDRVLALFA